MAEGFTLNDRFIRWDAIDSQKGNSRQELATLTLVSDWLSGKDTFSAFTSGSTGNARELTFSRKKALLSATRTIDFFGLTNSDHAFVCMDTEKIAGKMMIIRALEAGMALTVVEPSRLPDWHARPYTFTAVAPIQLGKLLENPPAPRSLKCILVGGAPVSLRLSALINLKQVPVWETYGMTETLSHIAVRKVSIDHPYTPFELIQTVEIRTNAAHCLSLKGDITDNAWLETNDCVEILDDSRFRWLGRADFTINSGGIKIQPEQVERSISGIMDSHGISEYFIHGFPHPEYGHAAVLVIGSPTQTDHGELLDRIKNVTQRYMNPLKIAVASEFIYGPTGKLERNKTAALLLPFTF